jgi:hypothetical protein
MDTKRAPEAEDLHAFYAELLEPLPLAVGH